MSQPSRDAHQHRGLRRAVLVLHAKESVVTRGMLDSTKLAFRIAASMHNAFMPLALLHSYSCLELAFARACTGPLLRGQSPGSLSLLKRRFAEPGIGSERGRNVAEPLRALLDRASLFAVCSAWPCTICFSVGGARGGHLELAVRRTGNPRFKPLHSAHLLEMGSGLHVRTASNG